MHRKRHLLIRYSTNTNVDICDARLKSYTPYFEGSINVLMIKTPLSTPVHCCNGDTVILILNHRKAMQMARGGWGELELA